MSETVAALAWCPFPDRDSARAVATRLLEEKLIACANILPSIESVFEWEGTASSATEVAVLFKTTVAQLDRLVEKLGNYHLYDTPAVMGWRCEAAYPATLHWLDETVGNPAVS